MTTTEFDLLLAFCRYPGRVLSREDLLSMTYAGLAGPIEQSVDVSRLPRKIDAAPDKPNDIQTVRLAGYLFAPDVVEGRGTGGPLCPWTAGAIVFVAVVTGFLVAAVAEDSFKHAVGGGLDDDEYRRHIAFLVVALARQSGSELGREECGRMAATAVTPLRIEKAVP